MVCAKFVQIIYVREWKIQQEGRKLCHSAALLEQGKIKIIREEKEKGEERERREAKTDVVNHFSNIINLLYFFFFLNLL